MGTNACGEVQVGWSRATSRRAVPRPSVFATGGRSCVPASIVHYSCLQLRRIYIGESHLPGQTILPRMNSFFAVVVSKCIHSWQSFSRRLKTRQSCLFTPAPENCRRVFARTYCAGRVGDRDLPACFRPAACVPGCVAPKAAVRVEVS